MQVADLVNRLVSNQGVVFIVAFMVMLTSAAIALALGGEVLANKLAEVAYYFLVIGVVAQLVNLVREERKKEGE